ncbi:MAG: CBS domain-containing protein [Chitinophagaceae bacterium]
MNNVASILSKKKLTVCSAEPNTPVIDALKLMAEKNIGSLLVLENGDYRGIITERDYARKVILRGKTSAGTTVADIMGTDLPKLAPKDSIEHCMALMSEKHIRYMPVFDGDKLVGVISMSDVVGAIILQQKETISHLQEYIHS